MCPHVGIVYVHWEGLSREEDSVWEGKQRESGRGLLVLHGCLSLLLKLTQILHTQPNSNVYVYYVCIDSLTYYGDLLH